MPFVVDASVVAAWAIEDESSDEADLLLVRAESEGVFSPDLIWYEIRNILLVSERRKRIAPQDSDEFLLRLQKLSMRLTEPGPSREVMRLARVYGLTGYDAAYLELAIRENLPLATLDRKLAHAAKAEGRTVLSLDAT